MKRIARILIRYRLFLLALMITLGVAGVCILPEVNIVSDMTTYLPDDSRMKHGLDSLKSSFSGIDINGAGVSAMFTNEVAHDSLATELTKLDGIAAIIGNRSNDRHTLYQFVLDPSASPNEVANSISSRYGDSVIVETASTNLLPDNMAFIAIVCVALLTLILVIMCASVIEAALFLVAIGIAVAINMGSNAFLPGVSVVTSAIAAILQLILSMDYSIILTNRYRQIRERNDDKVAAMTQALSDTTPPILSSAMTTILGMSMLAFMDFKIGLDMGLVLSKGVFLSLVSIYFVLPSLILSFDRLIKKTEKKVPLLHTYKLAKFEVRHRRLIAVTFVIFFVASYFLSKRTEISFSNTWPTEITREFPPQNQTVLLYNTDEQEKIIPLLDSLESDSKVVAAVSYPSIMLKERTADEMIGFIREMSAMLPAGAESIDSTMLSLDLLGIVYYAAAHPERNEMMSFSDIEQFVSELPAEYAAGFDIERMTQDIMNGLMEEEYTTPPGAEPEAPSSPEPETPSSPEPETPSSPEPEAPNASEPETPASAEPSPRDTVAATISEPDTTIQNTQASRFTFENSTQIMTSREMAEFLGFDHKQASIIYRFAGRSKSGMTAHEFIRYINENILSRKAYARMISDEQKSGLAEVWHQIDSAVAARPSQPSMTSTPEVPTDGIVTQTDTTAKTDTSALVVSEPTEDIKSPAAAITETQKVEKRKALSPVEVLMDMVGSDSKYSAEKIGSTLRNAGVDVAQSDIDLLFMFYGSRNTDTDSLKMSITDIMDFMTETLLSDPMYERFIDGSAKESILAMKQSMTEGLGNLRGEGYSIATIISDYETESQETFDFIGRLSEKCDETFDGECYLIGESVMYKEMKDGFSHEMMVVTLLTIIVIFITVALTFRSMIVPAFLLLIVLSAVYVCVFVGGLRGQPMNYLAYLVMQSILMGATIDYAILFTDYYREKRMKLPIWQALRKSYKNTIHSIMTSGLILILCPYIMSMLLTDPTISTILNSISVGALSAILLIIFVLPGLLAAFDRIVVKKGAHPQE